MDDSLTTGPSKRFDADSGPLAFGLEGSLLAWRVPIALEGRGPP